ncbi:MAG TPA: SpoIIE family protein phosphatase [Thermoanaerobaculia bacterium]|nr:SpoIIE family protein phosphatase [Thermoanaerobaculia bacterium]
MTIAFESARVEALVESARMLQATTDVDELLQHLLRSAMAHVLASRGFVSMEREGAQRIEHVRGLPPATRGALVVDAELRSIGIDHILPIGEAGLLGIGKLAGGELGEEQKQFLSALLGISAGAIENVRYAGEVRRLNQSLDRKLQEVRTLLELVRSFTSVTEPDEVARMLGLTLAGQWAVQRYAITARKAGHPDVVRKKGMTLPHLDRLYEAAAGAGNAVGVDQITDSELAEQLRAQKVAALVPIRSGEQIIGLVALGGRPGGSGYSEEELEYSQGLVDQAAVSLENAWHFRDTLEKKKIEKELELASEIQNRLLPSTMPQLPALDVFARTRPARHVGGDYYDAIALGNGETMFCVADVSGKGIAASLLMSNFQASLRALASTGRPLAEVVARMNDLMHASTASNKYVTAIFVRVDPYSRVCTLVNAGHNDGLIARADGTVDRIKASGTPVGLMPARSYTEIRSELAPGDVIALYSDGVTEANDPEENEFGDERLISLLQSGMGQSAEELVGRVFVQVDGFASTAPQYDDITMMIIRRTE